MKAVVAAFNQEKALVGAVSVITNLRMELFQALDYGDHDLGEEAAAADCDGDCGDTADGELKDGALRLTGGHDDTEVSWSLARVTCHV